MPGCFPSCFNDRLRAKPCRRDARHSFAHHCASEILHRPRARRAHALSYPPSFFSKVRLEQLEGNMGIAARRRADDRRGASHQAGGGRAGCRSWCPRWCTPVGVVEVPEAVPPSGALALCFFPSHSFIFFASALSLLSPAFNFTSTVSRRWCG